MADRGSDLLVQQMDDLRAVLAQVKRAHPFALVAMVALPEHLHAIWRLPPDDADFPIRWSLIKAGFSRRIAKGGHVGVSRGARRGRGIWQRRYWEHQIRDETDLARHVNYIHYNPVKHGRAKRPVDWPHSTLHGYIDRGIATPDWGAQLGTEGGNFGER
ncbi:MAG: transposase [Burkholderiales bacterium]